MAPSTESTSSCSSASPPRQCWSHPKAAAESTTSHTCSLWKRYARRASQPPLIPPTESLTTHSEFTSPAGNGNPAPRWGRSRQSSALLPQHRSVSSAYSTLQTPRSSCTRREKRETSHARSDGAPEICRPDAARLKRRGTGKAGPDTARLKRPGTGKGGPDTATLEATAHPKGTELIS